MVRSNHRWWCGSGVELIHWFLCYSVNITTAVPLDDTLARQWRQGYYASVRFTDEMIGRVLGGLATSGRADETVVVIHGDHGWQVTPPPLVLAAVVMVMVPLINLRSTICFVPCQLGEHGEWYVARMIKRIILHTSTSQDTK